jgi:hypothetical protein
MPSMKHGTSRSSKMAQPLFGAAGLRKIQLIPKATSLCIALERMTFERPEIIPCSASRPVIRLTSDGSA